MKLISLKDALDFADFYHNALRNAERRTVEEEFAKRNIPTISPVEIIEQELNELKIAHPIAKRYGGDAQYISCIRILEKLLQKFKSLS